MFKPIGASRRDNIMPLQELSAPPPVTGYSALGNVLASQGADALQRSRQLQDVQSARAYASAEGDKRRSEQLQDAQTMEKFRNREAGIRLLINEGYLNESQVGDENAVNDARARFVADGRDKIYQELFNTPDESGKPLLSHEEATNPALVQAAKDKLGAIKAKQLQGQLAQPANAQATVNDLQQQLAQVRAQKQAVTQAANQPVPQYQPNDPKVVQLAQQLAEQIKPGSGKNREAVAAQMPVAYKQLNDQALMAWSQGVQSAKIELESLRRSEAELTDALVRTSQTFKVAPSVHGTAAPAVLQNPGPTVPRVATAEEIAAALRAAMGGARPTPAPDEASGSSALLDNPTNDPTISAANEDVQQRQAQAVKDSLNLAITQGNEINQKIAAARQGQLANPTTPAFSPMGVPLMPASSSRYDAGKAVADLLKQKADNDARVKALQAQLIGPIPATGTAPVMNSAGASTPTIGAAQAPAAWWQTANPPPISGM